MPNHVPPPHVLIVDDDPALLTLLAETMLESGAPKTVSTAEDGSRALQMLLGGMRPNLILLDLKMPEVPGDEVLGRVKSDPTLSRIPVIVLTASDAEADIAKCLRLRANSFVVKPSTLEGIRTLVRDIDAFWSRAHPAAG